jgi:hypothetical protein
VFIKLRNAKTLVSVLIILGEIEIVLNQRSPSKGVVTDAVASNPGVEERQREKKKKSEQALRFSRAAKRRWAEFLLGHERGTRRKLLLSPATILTGQHHDVEPISQDRGRDLVTTDNRSGIIPHDVISELDIRELKGGCLPSPKQFEAELDLARCGGRAGNHASRWRNARGSEDDGVGQIEICAVKQVE